MPTTDIDGLRAARDRLDEYERVWQGRIQRMRDLLDGARRDDTPPTRSTP